MRLFPFIYETKQNGKHMKPIALAFRDGWWHLLQDFKESGFERELLQFPPCPHSPLGKTYSLTLGIASSHLTDHGPMLASHHRKASVKVVHCDWVFRKTEQWLSSSCLATSGKSNHLTCSQIQGIAGIKGSGLKDPGESTWPVAEISFFSIFVMQFFPKLPFKVSK